MQSFKKFITENSKPSGAEFENIICCAYNMMSQGVSKEEAIKLAETQWKGAKFDPWLETGKKIVESSFGSNPKGIMKHYGASSASLNKNWDMYFVKTTGKSASSATKTPKTDMYIGNMHISLKKYGGSQLMSGGQAESLATFAAAYDNLPANIKNKTLEEGWNNLTNRIENEFVKFKLPKGKKINDFKDAIKLGIKDDITNFIKSQLEKQTEMTKALESLLSLPEVRKEVVREAMTGNKKFEDSLPIATHVMKWDENGNSQNIEIDDRYVSYVASKTTFNISFKTAGTGKGAWTATKGIFNESFDHAWNNSLIECLNEGIFDVVSKKIKSGINFLKTLLFKMLRYIWTKIKKMLLSGFEYVKSILGIQLVSNDPITNF